jgi:hypothetical protein
MPMAIKAKGKKMPAQRKKVKPKVERRGGKRLGAGRPPKGREARRAWAEAQSLRKAQRLKTGRG